MSEVSELLLLKPYKDMSNSKALKKNLVKN